MAHHRAGPREQRPCGEIATHPAHDWATRAQRFRCTGSRGVVTPPAIQDILDELSESSASDWVSPADIRAQRAAGWPDFHPEAYCHQCGRPNIVWWVDGDLWSKVMEGGIVCPVCFAKKANALGVGDRGVWRLVPQCEPEAEYSGLVARAKMADQLESERDAYRAALEACAEAWPTEPKEVG